MKNYEEELSKIRGFLLENPRGLTVSEISKKLNINRNSVAKYLDVLNISGHVEMHTVGAAKVFFLSHRVPLNSILNFSSDYIMVLNRDLVVLDANERLIDIMDAKREEVVGQKFLKSPHNPINEIKDDIHDALNGKEIKRQIYFKTPKKRLYLKIRMIPTTFENTDPGITIIMEDITATVEAEKNLLEKEQRYRGLVNNMTSGVVVYEPVDNGNDFIIKEFNNAGLHIEKITREDAIGKRVTEVFPGVREFGILDAFKRVAETGNPENFPVKLYKDNRIEGWKENYIYRLESGEVVAVYNDITEKKKAEEAAAISESKYQTIFDSVEAAIFVHDPKTGKILDVNDGMCKLFGYTKEEAVNMNIVDVSSGKPPYTQEKAVELVNKARKEGSMMFEWMSKNKEGKDFPAEVVLKFVKLGNDERVIAIVHDMSPSRKKASKI